MRIPSEPFARALNRAVLDVVFILGAIALIAGVALLGKAVERL